jgi:hypothetical protein
MFNAGSTKKVLTTMYETLNEAKYFGSAMHANWAKEALELLIKDVNL